jgi:hypothetical protein
LLRVGGHGGERERRPRRLQEIASKHGSLSVFR